MKSAKSHRTGEFPAHRAEGADAAQIGDGIVATWLNIEVALKPIIGQRGVVALFNRSLHLTARTHTWLTVDHGSNPTAMNLAALKPLIAEQPRAAAAAATGLLLKTFLELLTSLIGPSLTERLLRTVLSPLLSEPSSQDISP